MKSFCPNCGKNTKVLFKGLCKQCFLELNDLIIVSNILKIGTCKHCFRLNFQGKMVSQSKDLLDEFVKSNIKLKHLEKSQFVFEFFPNLDATSDAEIKVSGLVEGKPFSLKKQVLIKPQFFTCNDCMKLSSNYHEGIIQLRFDKKFSEKKLEKILNEVNDLLVSLKNKHDLSVLVKQVKVLGGRDLFIGSKKAAKVVAETLAKKFKTKAKPSFSLVGVNSKGKRKYRATFLVRVS